MQALLCWQRSVCLKLWFSTSHVWMWELDYKEGWVLKNWCFWTVLLENTLESPLDCKEIRPVNPKGNQSWIFIRRTDAESETNTLATWCKEPARKDPDAAEDWGQEKGMTEGEMVGWHLWFNGYEFEQAPGDGEGQGSLLCYSSWHREELDMTVWVNNNNNKLFTSHIIIVASPS